MDQMNGRGCASGVSEMTDGCGTSTTGKGLGLDEKHARIKAKNSKIRDNGAAVCSVYSQFAVDSEAGKVCVFHV